ncbi:MAG: bifunctional 3-(3-hydroxy-phenyl)propionate/3-hydroxycinnamic acid hydroxylase [Mycolicibacterium sp.]|uniref:bifunctional 3-(3-hydroxy-phenyl)propionate/3-hydroxycinnamic acid hydroxylase n=1 Tax=Mycolicibacterium sp. TaxID=2320850 RepID=UPI000FBA06E0|nr:bifunctional 3-(3-hydroxy-phenyl)propionate/3-hydroxycinnamic acid hydroxylase [Mycolicibacterium sp.]RUP34578.1 MAG: bifunctional 3-(3-hydroxy-phenyl)propionate/3-hydroxycinnamic acid hydroxylase [Mycolicibacterium sp.]
MSADDPVDCFDVAVVGLGPVGELAAILLARSDLRVLAVDREADVYGNPRVGVLDGEALRSLQKAGVYEQAVSDMICGAGAQWASRSGRTLATTLPSETPQAHPWLSAIYQPSLDRHLRTALAGYQRVDVRVNQQLTGLVQDAEGVTLELRDAQGAVSRARARLVLGCDGANSTVRDAVGVELEGSTFTEPWVIVDAKLPEPIAHVPYFRFTMDPAGPRMTGRLADGNHRWERKVMPHENHDDVLQPGAAAQMIAEHADPDTAQILRHVVYTFQAKQAQRWRVGRVMLCGDAAHLMPPMAGQGLNSGIRDVTNLSWKVSAVLQAGAPLELLDTYEDERRPHVVAMTNLSLRAGRLIMLRSARAAAVRDGALAAMVHIPQVRQHVRQGRYRPPARYRRGLLIGAPSRRSSVGMLFPQPYVRDYGGHEHRLDDIAGSGWRIVGWGEDPRAALSVHGQRLAAEVLNATFVTLCRPGGRSVTPGASTHVLEDISEMSHRMFRDQPFVVVRPDHYVCANPPRPELDSAIRHIVQRVSSRRSEPVVGESDPSAGTWLLDPATVQVGFAARGMWGLLPVSGHFTQSSGSLTWNDDGSAAVYLEVQAASIATGLKARDHHLRSPDFLDAVAYPTISFRGHATAQRADALTVRGELTIRGRTVHTEVEVEISRQGAEIVGQTTARITLSDFGITPRFGIVRPTVDLRMRGRLVAQSADVIELLRRTAAVAQPTALDCRQVR